MFIKEVKPHDRRKDRAVGHGGVCRFRRVSPNITLLVFLHELCHVLAWTPEGHDKRFEETLDAMLAQYNREHGTDLKNDYAGYRGDKSR